MRLDLKSRSRLMIFFLGLNAMVSGSNACLAQSTGGVNSLAADLRNGFKQNLNSYQRALWYAYHAIIETLDGKEWIQIRPSLEAQQFHIEDMCSGGPGTRRYEITLPGLGYQPPSGPVHPLIIDLNTSQKSSRATPTSMTIRIEKVCLRAVYHQSLTSVVQNSPYLKGSVLDTFLKLPELTSTAAMHPLLETLELQYHPPTFLLDQRGEYYEPYGYRITAELVRKDREHIYTKWAIFEAPSGLDPQTTWDGKKTKPVDFPSGDTFGKISPSSLAGESESGLATDSVIKRMGSTPTSAERPHDLRTAYSMADLRSLPTTTTALRMEGKYITGNDVSEIARLKALTYLDMSECQGDDIEYIRESDLLVIGKLHNLTHLELNGASVTDRLCDTISMLKDLTSLTIIAGSITDTGVKRLARLPLLETLEVPYCRKLTDASLQTIGAMKHLKRLNIFSGGEYSNTGLNNLGRLNQLLELKMGNLLNVTAQGLVFLRRLPALGSLSLAYMPIRDAALGVIASLQRLRTLEVRELYKITDADIMKFRTLNGIEWLSIQNCPKVTPAGINRLREALPPSVVNWVIEYSSGSVKFAWGFRRSVSYGQGDAARGRGHQFPRLY